MGGQGNLFGGAGESMSVINHVIIHVSLVAARSVQHRWHVFADRYQQTCWRSVIIHASLVAVQSLQHR